MVTITVLTFTNLIACWRLGHVVVSRRKLLDGSIAVSLSIPSSKGHIRRSPYNTDSTCWLGNYHSNLRNEEQTYSKKPHNKKSTNHEYPCKLFTVHLDFPWHIASTYSNHL